MVYVNDILPRRVDNSEGGDNEDFEERVEPDIEEQAESWRGQDAWHEEGQAEEFNIAAAAILNSQVILVQSLRQQLECILKTFQFTFVILNLE